MSTSGTRIGGGAGSGFGGGAGRATRSGPAAAAGRGGAGVARLSMGTAFFYGAAIGVVGVAIMTVTQKIEQAITGRPNSFVPGHTTERLLGLAPRPDAEIWHLQYVHHYGIGMVAGGVRALMAYYGMHGPITDFIFTGLRLTIDQTLENWTGVGALPWTWPVNEQIIDLAHKAIYAFSTGYIIDRLLP